MGLLDSLTYDPQMSLGMGLLAAGGNSRTPVSFGQGLASGWQQMQEAAKEKQKADMLAQQLQMQALQMKQLQQKAADEEAMRNFDFGQYYQSPQSQALAGGGGPTIENAAKIPGHAPKFDTRGMIGGMMASKNPALMQQALGMLTKDEAPVKLGKDEQLLTKNPDGTYKPVASNLVQDVKNGYLVSDGKGGWKVDPTLFAAEKDLKATAAPKISVSPTVKVGNTFAEGVAKQGADRLFSQVEAAASAPEMAGAAQQILGAIETGKVMAGPGTKWKIAANQLFGSDAQKLTSTRQTIQGLAKLSLQGRQSLRGQGTITDSEQKMLAEAASGNIDDLSVGEIQLIANGAIKNAMFVHSQGKKASAALKSMPEFGTILPAFDIPDLPVTVSPPPGAVQRIK